MNGVDEGDAPPPYTQVTQKDLQETQRNLDRLRRDLNHAFEVGDVSGSGSVAQQITHYRLQLKQQQAAYDGQEEQRNAENAWMQQQMQKVNNIKQKVEDKRKEVEQIQQELRDYILNTQTRQTHNNNTAARLATSSATSLGQSILSAFTSHLPQHDHNNNSNSAQQQLHPCQSLVQRVRRVIKETQVILEQQNLLVDTIDMNSHPSNSHSSAPSPSLISIKAIRKDCVTYIQSQLQHVDALEKHLNHFEEFIRFLHIETRPSYAAPVDRDRDTEEKAAAGSNNRKRSSPNPRDSSGRYQQRSSARR